MTALDTAVQDQVDDGRVVIVPLIKFEIPDHTVGYWKGGRDFTWDGFLYKANRCLDLSSLDGQLGSEVTKRTIGFSDVPTTDPDDVIATIESYDYISSTVILAYLLGDPDTDEILGDLTSQVYQIDKLTHTKSAPDDRGMRTVSLSIDLEPTGRTFRNQTYAKRSTDDQQFDNLATDTAFEYAAVVKDIPVEWGQRSG